MRLVLGTQEYWLDKQVKQVYNDQPQGILALGKIGGGNGSLVSLVSRVCP